MNTSVKIVPVLLAASVHAAVVADVEPEHVLVTGAYTPQDALTASASVLDREQIRALNKRSISELLQTLPGLLVEQQGGPGGLTAVSIRGAEANFTLVLLDGVPLNDPTNSRGGGFDFANLNMALVERIEVVRGPQSAVYGSDALAGVINIITRRPQQGHRQTLFAQWGEKDFSELGVSARGATDSFEYSLVAATRDDGEPVKGSGRDSGNLNLGLGWNVSDRQVLSAQYRYLDGERSSYPEQSGGPEYALSDALDHSDYREEVLAIAWQATFNTVWNSNLRGSRFDHQESYVSPGILPYIEVPPNVADTDFTRDELQWVNSLALAPGYQLDVGVDYRDEEGDSIGYLDYFGVQLPTDFSLDRSTTGVFASLSAQPAAALLLQASARYDDPDDYDSETSLHIGADYQLGGGFSLAVNWGEAFKLPSFFALGHGLVGNPDLQPELATSWDLGLAWDHAASLRLQATAFFNEYEDLVDFDDDTFRNVNRKNVETSGAELQASWLPFAGFALRAQATYTDIDVKSEDTVLTGRPEWTAGASADWQLAPAWRTVLDYHYGGEQWAASRHTGEEVTRELDDYHRLDWALHWQPSAAWQFSLAADNLLDEDYETAVGFLAPGRLFRLGVRYSHR